MQATATMIPTASRMILFSVFITAGDYDIKVLSAPCKPVTL